MKRKCLGCRRPAVVTCHACRSFFCIDCTRLATLRHRFELWIAGFDPEGGGQVIRRCWPCAREGVIANEASERKRLRYRRPEV